MAISKRYDASSDPLAYRTVSDFGVRSFYEHPKEEVWPVRRAVWFWLGLSAVGWIIITGLAV